MIIYIDNDAPDMLCERRSELVCPDYFAGADIDGTKICDADEPVTGRKQPFRCCERTCQFILSDFDSDVCAHQDPSFVTAVHFW